MSPEVFGCFGFQSPMFERLAQAALVIGEYEVAKKLSIAAIPIAQNDAMLAQSHQTLARSHHALGNFSKAMTHYSQVIPK